VSTPAGDSTRRYSSPLREESTAATRHRIVSAAAGLFSSRGYSATTLPAIATAAGVSVQSVHLAGPKARLLVAAFELSFAGDEGEHPFAERPAVVEIMEMPSSQAVDAYCVFVALANEKSSGVMHALRAAAETDAEVAELLVELGDRGHQDFLTAVGWAEGRGLLHGDANADERAEVLAYLAGAETYRYFVGLSGWSHERYSAWLRNAIEQLVLGAVVVD
jgi:AcrR family transcriptional regulator